MARQLGSKNLIVRDRCRRGHLRTPENTRIHAVTGHICCRTCENLWAKTAHKQPRYRKAAAERMARWRASPGNRLYLAALTKERRREKYRWIAEYKSSRGCSRCDEKRAPALDLHHRNGKEKLINITAAVQKWTDARIMAEIEKCDILCANCHRVLHDSELRARLLAGPVTG